MTTKDLKELREIIHPIQADEDPMDMLIEIMVWLNKKADLISTKLDAEESILDRRYKNYRKTIENLKPKSK